MYWLHSGFGFWPLFPLFWIGLIVWLCRGAGRWFGWRGRRGPFVEANAQEILRQRYARGEIDGTTFDHMRERLQSSDRPHE
ncbi:SHOCT domain-containing protein [Ktedonobacteria bacterium brp13]|nr:SHOCT domain-containing protein [Ktedonobacteria bacterium brp13]